MVIFQSIISIPGILLLVTNHDLCNNIASKIVNIILARKYWKQPKYGTGYKEYLTSVQENTMLPQK